MYRLDYRKSVEKDLRKIPSKDLNRIVNRIQSLSNNPHPDYSTKIKGHQNLYRIRQGNYRVVYSVDSQELQVLIIHVAHRKDVYTGI